MLNKTCSVFSAILFCVVCFSIGCGDTGRHPLQGTVKFDGKLLKNGVIRFHPISGTDGPNAGSKIVDGVYSVADSKGVFEGEFKVIIKGWRESKKMMEDSVTGEKFAEPDQFVPAKYNTDSTLTVKVESGKESYDFDLDP